MYGSTAGHAASGSQVLSEASGVRLMGSLGLGSRGLLSPHAAGHLRVEFGICSLAATWENVNINFKEHGCRAVPGTQMHERIHLLVFDHSRKRLDKASRT